MDIDMGEFVTLREASEMFGKSQSMLRKVHYNGEIESVRRNNKLFVKVQDLEQLYGISLVPKARSATPLIIDARRPELRDVFPSSTPIITPFKEVLEEEKPETNLVTVLNTQIEDLKQQVQKLETIQVEKDRYYQNELEDSKKERQEYMNELSQQIKLFNEKWEREQVLHLKQTESNQRLMEAVRAKDQQISQLLYNINQEKEKKSLSLLSGLSKWLQKNF
jgi:hypothetical protein